MKTLQEPTVEVPVGLLIRAHDELRNHEYALKEHAGEMFNSSDMSMCTDAATQYMTVVVMKERIYNIVDKHFEGHSLKGCWDKIHGLDDHQEYWL